MANQVYVNVNGTWRSVSNYYVNVNGVWKTGTEIGTRIGTAYEGMTEAPMYTSGFPTYLQVATLDFAEYMAAPAVFVSAKSGITAGSTLDLPDFLARSFWYLDSTFVYSPPSGGGSTPTDVLPVFNTTYALDLAEFTCVPTLQGFGSKSGIDTRTLDYAEFTAVPITGNLNNSTYTAPSGGGGTPAPSIMPTVQNLLTLDYSDYLSVPRIRSVAKSGLNTDTLDFAEYMSLPHYVMGSSGPTTPALTKTVVYNFEPNSGAGSNVSGTTNTNFEYQTSGTGATTNGNAESTVPSDPNLASATTTGKRLVIVIASFRFPQGGNFNIENYPNTGSNSEIYNTDGIFMMDKDNPMTLGVGWGASSKQYTQQLTFRDWVATEYNTTSVWTAFTDYASSNENRWYIDAGLNVSCGGKEEGNGFTYIILDDISNIEYISSGVTDRWDQWEDTTATENHKVTSALSVNANNSTNATHVLRLAISNCSNIDGGEEMGYNKGATEPTYTTLADYSNGGIDNGTDERHHIEYSFGTHGTQANMTGTFGSSSNTDVTHDGFEGLGLIIGLS